jgi:hypothetical protein
LNLAIVGFARAVAGCLEEWFSANSQHNDELIHYKERRLLCRNFSSVFSSYPKIDKVVLRFNALVQNSISSPEVNSRGSLK